MSGQHFWRATACGGLILSVWLLTRDVHAQRAPTTHMIFMNAVEIKGATTTETLLPP